MLSIAERRKIVAAAKVNGRCDFPTSELYPPDKNNTTVEYYIYHRDDGGQIKTTRCFTKAFAESEAEAFLKAGKLTGTVKAYYMGYA